MPVIETPYWWETDPLNISPYFFKDNNTKSTYDLAIVGEGRIYGVVCSDHCV